MNGSDFNNMCFRNLFHDARTRVELQKTAEDHARKIGIGFDNGNVDFNTIINRLDRIDNRLNKIERMIVSNPSPFCIVHDGVCVSTQPTISLTDEQFRAFINEIKR